MKYLITGGAGFIGSNFCQYMVDKYPNDQFVCLDALTYAANLKNLDSVINNNNFKFIEGNICDEELVEELFEDEKFDYVINFAGESHVDKSITEPNIFLVSNVIGVQILLDASKKYKVKRFHQISTDEVYGDLPLDRPDLLFSESSILKPSSPYSVSKASADLLVLAYHRTYGMDVTISRSSNNYGIYQHEEKLIPLVIKKALKNEKIPVHGTGLNIRDWLYVLDHCSAIDLIVKNGRSGEIYNVGVHDEKTNLDVIKMILKYLGKDESLIEFTTDRLGHDLRYALDNRKIINELGWMPVYKFYEEVHSVISYYIDKYNKDI